MLREGGDVTIVSHLLMVHRARHAADKLAEQGIDAEVIDARSLGPVRLGNAENLHRENRTGGIRGGMFETRRGFTPKSRQPSPRRCWNLISAPVKRIAAPNTPAPFAPVMENFYIPQIDDIISGVKELVEY